jgi:hypothetical protein
MEMMGWKDFQRLRIERAEAGLAEDVPHGVLRYIHYGCRCDICKAANSARHKAAREARKQRAHEAPNHGTYSTYVNWGCQCGPCHEIGVQTLRDQAAKRRENVLAKNKRK